MMRNWDDAWGVGSWVVMGFGMVLFWALLVAGLIWIIRSANAGPRRRSEPAVSVDKPSGTPRPNALDILDQRYARGEIGDDEYRTRRDTLASR